MIPRSALGKVGRWPRPGKALRSHWPRLLLGIVLIGTIWAARSLSAQYPPGPQIATDGTAVLLQDYASLPLSSATTGTYPPAIDVTNQLARVNVLRHEPAAAPLSSTRVFVSDSNRNLYILDGPTRTFTPYLNFEEIFPKFANSPGFSAGLVAFTFGPAYAADGTFYTVHTEDPSKIGAPDPANASVPGLDLAGYLPTPPIDPPSEPAVRQAILVEWTDTNISDSTFQGTAREVLRVGFTDTANPIGDILFNPAAQPCHPDYGNLYVAVGDGGAGELPGATRSIPQRLDALQGKILRITPDITLRPDDLLGANGRYRIPTSGPDANPFVSLSLPNVKPEIYAYGFRNPHRMSWDAISNLFFVNDVGLDAWEEVNVVRKGSNYGYPEREGPETNPFPDPDTLSVAGLAAPVEPVYPVAAYSHRDGDAIGSGFVYRGTGLPHLYGMYVFGDITTGRLFYTDLPSILAASSTSPAPIHEIQVVYDSPYDGIGAVNRRLYDIVADAYAARGGDPSPASSEGVLPGSAGVVGGPGAGRLDISGVPYGGGRADVRVAEGGDGEIYVLSKSDGTIRVAVPLTDQPEAPATSTLSLAATVETASESAFLPPAGLVAGYGFEEGGGNTTHDVSGNSLTATISGATWIAQGRFGNALSFDGVNDWVTVADADVLDLTTGLTIEAWVYPTASGGVRDILIKEGAGVDVYNLYARNGQGKPEANVFVGGSNRWAPGPALPLNTWTHVAGTYDGATIRLYLNGVQAASLAFSGAIATSTGPLRIGGNSLWGEFFQGHIDEIRVYNRALSAAEIEADLNAAVGSSADTTGPTVAVTAPADGATVAGVTTVTASVSDNVGVVGVQFLLDGVNLGAEDTTPPYSISWDTTAIAGGAHHISARARDAAGNSVTSAPVGVSVVNTNVPAHFVDEVVVGSGLTFPTAMEFLPDGRMLIAEFTGRVLVVQPGASAPDPTPVLQLTNFFNEDVTIGGERGLVNVIADPGFAANGFIYLFYTAASPQRDRVSRFTMAGNTADPASEFVVWQAVADSTSTDHHGGGLAFGPDGKLYISTGDNGDPPSVQSLTGDHGKILRVNTDGTVPTDNPHFDGPGPIVDAIWAGGLRNPYRFSFDLPTGRMYIGDVGQSTLEEINIGVAGANYGWPNCEGPCGTPGLTNPLFSYPHGGRDAAVSGGFVYRGTQFPAAYQGAYFYGDFAQNWIRYLNLDAAGTAVTGGGNLLPANGELDGPYDPVMLKQGPEGSLYYVDFGWGWQSTANPASIRRIRYAPDNQVPIAVASAIPLSGPAPLSVSFSSAGSADPENQPLSYEWTFGDGGTSTEAHSVHVYAEPGVYNVQLVVSDGVHSVPANVLTVSAGTLPVGTITAPAHGATFRAGDVITFAGEASDAEDGPLPASSMTWTVLFHHDTHAHPAVGPLSGTSSGTFAIQTSGHDFSDSTNYEILLTVTDSDGLQHTSSVTIYPEKVDLTFQTDPPGLRISIDGVNHTTPYVHDTLIGFRHTVGAPDQASGPQTYSFSAWSDGGSQTHDIIVPASSATYVASFTQIGPPPPPPGLVAGYGFDEGSGNTTQDVSGNNLAGAISGATWTTQGRYGNALSFDGVNDWVTVADAGALDLTTGMTLEAWVYPTASGGNSWRNVVIKERPDGEVYNLYSNATGNVPRVYVVRAAQTNNTLGASGTAAVPLNAWTHLAATYNGATLRLYVNGAQVGSRSVTGPLLASGGALRIGGNSIWGEFFEGRIDEVRIYNRALTAAEIQTDLNTPLGSAPADTTPPVLGNGQPAGTLAAGTTQALLGVTTSEAATCRYGTTPGTPYDAMPATFAPVGGTTHTSLVSGLADGGSYAFYVRCQDLTGNANTTDFGIAFSVANPPPPDTVAPAVTIVAPADGFIVSGAVTITAAATDNVGVAGVQFLLDGVPLGAEDTTQPFSLAWPSTSVTNGGPYQIAARARDAAGNETTASIGVTVNNTAPSGLVAGYGFEEGSGNTTQDVSGNNLTATISGATWTTQGRFGSALSFDGVNDWVTVADANALDLTTGMTLEAWVHPTATGGDSWRNLVIKERPGGEVYNLYANVTGNVPRVYVIRAAQPGMPADASGVTDVPVNTWTHLAATYDGATLRLYVNGLLVGTRAVSGPLLTSSGVLRLGGNSIWGEFFQGRLDEVRIYNRALSAAEIQADMNAPAQP